MANGSIMGALGFIGFIRQLRVALRYVFFLIGAAVCTLFLGLLAMINAANAIYYRWHYGATWRDAYEARFGAGSLAEDQKVMWIGGLASLAIVLVLIWGCQNAFVKKKPSRNPNRRRRRRSSEN
jgi:hypothetical protein